VARGDALRLLEQHFDFQSGQLTRIRRQLQAEYRKAVELAVQKRTVEAFAQLERMGAVTELSGDNQSNHHLMSTNINPAATSPSSPRDNPCFSSDPSVATLNVFADDGISYQLPYAQFLYAKMIPNPALESKPDAPPEKLLLCFAVADVAVLGSGLKSLERVIQKYELKFVKSADGRYADTLKTPIAAVATTFSKEVP